MPDPRLLAEKIMQEAGGKIKFPPDPKTETERYWWWGLIDEPLGEKLECDADEDVTEEKLVLAFIKWAIRITEDPRFMKYCLDMRAYTEEGE